MSEASGAEQNPPPCGRGAGTTVQGRNAYTGRAAVARFAIAIAVTHSISCPESLSQKMNVPRSAFTTPANAWIPCLNCPPSTGITGRSVSPRSDETCKGFGGEVTPPRSGSCGQDPLTVVAPAANRTRCCLYTVISASARFPREGGIQLSGITDAKTHKTRLLSNEFLYDDRSGKNLSQGSRIQWKGYLFQILSNQIHMNVDIRSTAVVSGPDDLRGTMTNQILQYACSNHICHFKDWVTCVARRTSHRTILNPKAMPY